jgi:hypothetical protein
MRLSIFIQLLSETVLILRRTQRDNTNVHAFMKTASYSHQNLTKLEFSRQIFEKFSNFKFHKSQFSGSRDADSRTERNDENNSRFSEFCQKPRYGVKEIGCSDHSDLLHVIYVTQHISPYIHHVYLQHTYAGTDHADLPEASRASCKLPAPLPHTSVSR